MKGAAPGPVASPVLGVLAMIAGCGAPPAPVELPALDPTAGWQAAMQPWTRADDALPAVLPAPGGPDPVADPRRTFRLASDGTVTYHGFVLCRARELGAELHLRRQLRDVRAVGLAAQWLHLTTEAQGGTAFEVVAETFAVRAAADARWGDVGLVMRVCSKPDIAFWNVEVAMDRGDGGVVSPPPRPPTPDAGSEAGAEPAEVLHPSPHSPWLTPATELPDGILADGRLTWLDLQATRPLRTIVIGADGAVRWRDEVWFDPSTGSDRFAACVAGLKRLRRQGLTAGFLELERMDAHGGTRRVVAQGLQLTIDARARYVDVAIVVDACRAAGFERFAFGAPAHDGTEP